MENLLGSLLVEGCKEGDGGRIRRGVCRSKVIGKMTYVECVGKLVDQNL